MRWRVRHLASLTAVAMTLTGVTAAAAGTPQEPQSAAPSAAQRPRTITLITGDRVTVQQEDQGAGIAVTPGPGREEVAFYRVRSKQGWSVIPADAHPLVASGALDRRLFQVDRLLADGFDDASTPTLPLIVQQGAGVAANTAFPGAERQRPLKSIGGTALVQRRSQAGEFWKALVGQKRGAKALATGVSKVWLDGKVAASLDRSVPQIGAPDAWRSGLTGKGVTVAVVDTGVDDSHPDLKGKVTAENFTEESDTLDRDGHGTHVASTIAGSGAASGGAFRGVAPDAKLLSAKVLSGGIGRFSWIINGMEWAAGSGAKVINMSLGGTDTDGEDPLEQAVRQLTAERNVLFVIAAGNKGAPGSIGSPGSAESALTVGAVDRDDQLAPFSSRGPRVGDNGIKPDITAPGVDIVAARARATTAQNTEAKPGVRHVNDSYTAMSGTSMATPHVAGAAAIVAQQHPDWSPERIKAALTGSAKPTPGLTEYEQGAGRVDLARAIAQPVAAAPGTLSFGFLQWPQDPKPATQKITYRNHGTAPVTVKLRLDIKDEAGKPAEAFTVDSSTLTIPAGGEAAATVTAKVGPMAPGTYSGLLTAASDGDTVTVRTPVWLNKEPERYSVDMKFRDRFGKVPYDGLGVGALIAVFNLDTGDSEDWGITEGEGTLRLAPARYLFVSVIMTTNLDTFAEDLSVVTEPGIELRQNRNLMFDARGARQTKITTDQQGAKRVGETFRIEQEVKGGDYSAFEFYRARNADFYIAPTKDSAGFRFSYNALMAERGADGDFTRSPYSYNLMFPSKGRIPDREYRVRDRDLAKVNASYASTMPDRYGTKWVLPQSFDFLHGFYMQLGAALPHRRTEYYSPDTRWSRYFGQTEGPTPHQFVDVEERERIQYRAGQQREERWNNAIVAPGLAPAGSLADRDDNKLSMRVPLYAPSTRGRFGHTSYTEGTAKLLRGGREIGSQPYDDWHSAEFTMPKDSGNYTLSIDSKRSDQYVISELSTAVSATWKFRSERNDGRVALPLMALRSTPELDQHNAAAAGQPLLLPIEVERNAGSAASPVREVTAEASFDDGRSWSKLVVWPTGGDKWQAMVLHPPKGKARFASLRLSAVDRAGGEVTQTVIRAYRLR